MSVIEDDGEASSVKKKLKERREIVAERAEQIELLEAGTHPIMIQAANDAAREYAKEYAKHKAVAEKLSKEANKAKAEYVSKVASASFEDKNNASKRNEVRDILKKADSELLEELGVNFDVERNHREGGDGRYFSRHNFQVTERELELKELSLK